MTKTCGTRAVDPVITSCPFTYMLVLDPPSSIIFEPAPNDPKTLAARDWVAYLLAKNMIVSDRVSPLSSRTPTNVRCLTTVGALSAVTSSPPITFGVGPQKIDPSSG